MIARSHWSLVSLVAVGLVLSAPTGSLADPASPAAPGDSPGAVIGRAVVETLVVHRKELGVVAAAATHEVVATSAADLGKLLEQDLATHGPASRIVSDLTVIVTRTATETMTKDLHDAFLDRCPQLSLRDCFKAGVVARGHELTAEVVTELTSRWWVRALLAGGLLFLLSATAAMTLLCIRLLRRQPSTGL
ncbi:hypothetical protein BH11MYX1_BH11MYX1_51760 [soil metagenome]